VVENPTHRFIRGYYNFKGMKNTNLKTDFGFITWMIPLWGDYQLHKGCKVIRNNVKKKLRIIDESKKEIKDRKSKFNKELNGLEGNFNKELKSLEDEFNIVKYNGKYYTKEEVDYIYDQDFKGHFPEIGGHLIKYALLGGIIYYLYEYTSLF